MKTVILLRGGIHPASHTPRPAPLEVQAIGLARALGASPVGLAAAPAARRESLVLYGAHGLSRLIHLPLAEGEDALPALTAWLATERPDLVLAARRSEAGRGTGLLPYRLAAALGYPLIADVIAAAPAETGLALTLYRPRGLRLAVTAAPPLFLTLHPAAPPGPAFAAGRLRTLRVEEPPPLPAPPSPPAPALPLTRRPYRLRPRLLRLPQSGDAAARRAAFTGLAGRGGRRLEGVSPEEAADLLLEALTGLGLLPAPPGRPASSEASPSEESLAPDDAPL